MVQFYGGRSLPKHVEVRGCRDHIGSVYLTSGERFELPLNLIEAPLGGVLPLIQVGETRDSSGRITRGCERFDLFPVGANLLEQCLPFLSQSKDVGRCLLTRLGCHPIDKLGIVNHLLVLLNHELFDLTGGNDGDGLSSQPRWRALPQTL